MDTRKKIPNKVSEYIRDHFREDFLFKVKEVAQVNGKWHYTVEVTKDDYIHTLQFNEKGTLVKQEEDQAFPTDIHEERGFDDLP